MTQDPTAQAPEEMAGRVFNGSVKLLRQLGAGGMGSVYLGEQIHLRRKVAVKVLHPKIARDTRVFERFKREAQICAALGSPHIIEVFDFNISEDAQPYIIMELLDGHDLEEELQVHGALELSRWLPLFLQICAALEATHGAGVVHRDLKPSNIFLCPREGGIPLVKILDFGVSKARGGFRALTQTGELLGTVFYMAPELALGKNEEVDPRADLYALGTISHEVLSGRPPFEGTSAMGILYKIVHEDPPPLVGRLGPLPRGLVSLIDELMSKDIDRRPASARVLRERIEALASGRGGVPKTLITGPLAAATGTEASALPLPLAPDSDSDSNSNSDSDPSPAVLAPAKAASSWALPDNTLPPLATAPPPLATPGARTAELTAEVVSRSRRWILLALLGLFGLGVGLTALSLMSAPASSQAPGIGKEQAWDALVDRRGEGVSSRHDSGQAEGGERGERGERDAAAPTERAGVRGDAATESSRPRARSASRRIKKQTRHLGRKTKRHGRPSPARPKARRPAPSSHPSRWGPRRGGL